MRSCHAPPFFLNLVGRSTPQSLRAEMGEGAHYDFDINFVYLFSIFFLHHCIGDPTKPQKGGMAFFQKKKGIILMRCGVLVFPNSPSVLNNTLHEKHPHWKMKCFSLHHWRMKMMKSFHESSFLKFIFF